MVFYNLFRIFDICLSFSSASHFVRLFIEEADYVLSSQYGNLSSSEVLKILLL